MTTRRQPPPFRQIAVRRTDRLTPRMIRVTLGGPDLAGFPVPEPAASVRLLLPTRDELIIPTWDGNEFLLPDGTRPVIRTFTPRRFDPDALELDLDIVIHEGGVAPAWATHAQPGDPAAISGPGRGYTIDPAAPAYLLVGDETAIPAICQLLETLPDVPITVHIEIVDPRAQLDLHRNVAASWHVLPAGAPPGATLVAAVAETDLTPGTRVWAAGEAAAMQRLRRHLFDERGIPRSHAAIRGYWKLRR